MTGQPAADVDGAAAGVWRSPGGLCILKAGRDGTREVMPGAVRMKHV